MVYTRRPSDQRCEEIYAYITEYVAENGHSPTFREVGNAVGLRSSSTVSRYIHRLVDEGRITIDESKPRTLTAAAPATNEGRMPTIISWWHGRIFRTWPRSCRPQNRNR